MAEHPSEPRGPLKHGALTIQAMTFREAQTAPFSFEVPVQQHLCFLQSLGRGSSQAEQIVVFWAEWELQGSDLKPFLDFGTADPSVIPTTPEAFVCVSK